MNNSFNHAQHQYDLRGPEEHEPQGQYEYTNSLNVKEQKIVCIEYLDSKEIYEDFNAWRDEKTPQGDWLDDVKEYCESLPAFWEWLE